MSNNKRVTFMIGNGFDLSCGLKTKYSDTYDLYLMEPSRSDQIKQFKEVMKTDITREIDTWANFEMSLAKHASDFYQKGCLFEGLSDYTAFLANYLSCQNDEFEKIISGSPMYVSGFGMLYHFYKSFPSQTESRLFSGLLDNHTNTYCVLDFNYTDTIDILLSNNTNPTSPIGQVPVIHVHGTIQEGMILGVDNIEQLNLPGTLSDREKRTIIKPFFNQIYDDTKMERAKNIIMSSDVICIYGLSLGESDKTWAETIIDWIKASPNHHIVVYDYTLEDIHTTLTNRKMDLCEDSKERFASKLFGEKDDSVIKQIHVPIGQKLFDINSFLKKDSAI